MNKNLILFIFFGTTINNLMPATDRFNPTVLKAATSALTGMTIAHFSDPDYFTSMLCLTPLDLTQSHEYVENPTHPAIARYVNAWCAMAARAATNRVTSTTLVERVVEDLCTMIEKVYAPDDLSRHKAYHSHIWHDDSYDCKMCSWHPLLTALRKIGHAHPDQKENISKEIEAFGVETRRAIAEEIFGSGFSGVFLFFSDEWPHA